MIKTTVKKFWLNLDSNLKEVFIGTLAAFTMRVAGALVQFIFNVLLARSLGAKGMGLYSLALIVSTLSSSARPGGEWIRRF